MSPFPLRAIRPLALVGAAAATLLLTGCVNPFTLAEQLRSQAPDPRETPASEVEETASSFAGDLTFERGAELTSASYIEWTDGLMIDEGWELASPDDGNGNWAYRTTDGLCTAAFWQGALGEGFDLAVGDRTLSDQLLGVKLGATAAEVEPYAVDDTIAAGIDAGGDVVDTRAVAGAEDGATWVLAGRGFAQPAVGHTVLVDCAAGREATEVFDEVLSKSTLVIW